MNLKRVLAVCIATALLVGLGVVLAYSAPGDAITDFGTAQVKQNSSFSAKSGEMVDFLIDNWSSIGFKPSNATQTQLGLYTNGDVDEAKKLLDELANVNFGTNAAGNNVNVFSGGSFQVNNSGNLVYRANTNTIYADTSLQYSDVKLVTNDGSVKSNNTQINGTLTQADGSITGIASPIFTQEKTTTESFTIPVLGLFTHNTTVSAIETGMLVDKGITTLTRSNSAFTVGFSSDYKSIQITPPASLAEGSHTLTISTTSADGSISGNIAQITFTIAPTHVYDIINTGASTTGSLSVAQGQTVNALNITASHFQFKSGANPPNPITTAYLSGSLNGFTLTSTKGDTSGVQVGELNTTNGTYYISNHLTAEIRSGTDGAAYVSLSAASGATLGTTSTRVYLYDSVTDRRITLYDGLVTITSQVKVGTITGINTSAPDMYIVQGNSVVSASDLEIEPGDVIYVCFNTDYFTWKDDQVPSPVTSIKGAGNLSNVKVEVDRNAKDRDLLVSLTPSLVHQDPTSSAQGVTYVKLEFKVPFVSTKDRDFSIPVTLRYGTNTSSSNTLKTTITGTIRNDVVYSYSGDRTIDISGGNGYIIDSDGSTNNAQIEFDDGVVMKTSLRRGLYYGYVDTIEDEDDDKVMSKYRDIQRVYNLYTIGLNGSETRVDLDENSSYHIYNKNMEYLGTGSDIRNLPYSTKYYVSTKKLDIEDDNSSSSASSSLDDPVVEAPIGATPGPVPPTNENYNPGTGR